MAIILYGIPNCDQVKKARNWLDTANVHYVFHDFKKSGISREMIDRWMPQVGWENMVNRKGTTWRALDDQRKALICDQDSAAVLMLESPSVIKRPLLDTGLTQHVGFSDTLYQQIFKK